MIETIAIALLVLWAADLGMAFVIFHRWMDSPSETSRAPFISEPKNQLAHNGKKIIADL